MSAVAERRSTIEQPKPALIESAQGQWPSTLSKSSIAAGGHRLLPPTHFKSWDYAMSSLTERLLTYRGLEDDWDGYGGQAATFGSFTNAIEFASKLIRRFVVPASMLAGDGEISLFWKQNGSYLEVSFPGDNTYHFIYKDSAEIYTSPDISLAAHHLDSKLLSLLPRN